MHTTAVRARRCHFVYAFGSCARLHLLFSHTVLRAFCVPAQRLVTRTYATTTLPDRTRPVFFGLQRARLLYYLPPPPHDACSPLPVHTLFTAAPSTFPPYGRFAAAWRFLLPFAVLPRVGCIPAVRATQRVGLRRACLYYYLRFVPDGFGPTFPPRARLATRHAFYPDVTVLYRFGYPPFPAPSHHHCLHTTR